MKKIITLCRPNRDNAAVSGYPRKHAHVARGLTSQLNRAAPAASIAPARLRNFCLLKRPSFLASRGFSQNNLTPPLMTYPHLSDFICSKILICTVLMFIAILFMAETVQTAEGGKKQADIKRLDGRWVRPDGGYILELREIKADGSLKAYYFNPRPINVARARIENNKKGISLSVELRDVNYPGSLYNLQYDPKTDRLKGTYFQAVERQTFAIEFVRSR